MALGPLPLLRPVATEPVLPGGRGGPTGDAKSALGGSGCSFLRSAIGLQERQIKLCNAVNHATHLMEL